MLYWKTRFRQTIAWLHWDLAHVYRRWEREEKCINKNRGKKSCKAIEIYRLKDFDKFFFVEEKKTRNEKESKLETMMIVVLYCYCCCSSLSLPKDFLY